MADPSPDGTVMRWRVYKHMESREECGLGGSIAGGSSAAGSIYSMLSPIRFLLSAFSGWVGHGDDMDIKHGGRHWRLCLEVCAMRTFAAFAISRFHLIVSVTSANSWRGRIFHEPEGTI